MDFPARMGRIGPEDLLQEIVVADNFVAADRRDVPVTYTLNKNINRNRKSILRIKNRLEPNIIFRKISQCGSENMSDKVEGNVCLTVEEISTNQHSKTDEDNKRCRICLYGQNLTYIFDSDGTINIAASIMLLCPSIKILRKDSLPHFICEKCLQSLRVAINFKTLGEATDKELRSKSKQRKVRETELIIIDCSGGGEIEENINFFSEDEEFHPPTDYDKTEYGSNSDSSYGIKKCKTRRSARRKRKRLSVSNPSKVSSRVSKRRLGRPRKSKTNYNDGASNDSVTSNKNIRTTQCVYCDEQFQSLIALREHKKIHVGEKPFKCGICDRTFKFIGSYKSHEEKHKLGDDLMCIQCNKRYPNKTELKRHLIDVHNEAVAKFVCIKCKRSFTSEKRLIRHNEGNCPGIETTCGKDKRVKSEPDSIALGRDLFKCVAPLTTTYWSDSFSD